MKPSLQFYDTNKTICLQWHDQFLIFCSEHSLQSGNYIPCKVIGEQLSVLTRQLCG